MRKIHIALFLLMPIATLTSEISEDFVQRLQKKSEKEPTNRELERLTKNITQLVTMQQEIELLKALPINEFPESPTLLKTKQGIVETLFPIYKKELHTIGFKVKKEKSFLSNLFE